MMGIGDPTALIDEGVRLRYPVAREVSRRFALGSSPRLRSGTVLYDRTAIGERFETGHNVIIREDCEIGDDVCVWSNTVVDYGCRIGNRVKIHTGCYIAQFTVLEDDAFLAPGVMIANDLYPGDAASAQLMAGPTIEKGAQIGVNVTILPYVKIGAGALIGSGSVVTKDVPAGVVAYGNPATPRKPVSSLLDIWERCQTLSLPRTGVPT